MIISVVWIGLGFFLMTHSYKLGLGSLQSPERGLMPFLIGAFLLLLSSYLLIIYLFGKGTRDKPLEEQRQMTFRKFGTVVVSCVVYGLVLERLGFILATFLLLSFLLWGMGSRLISALATSLLTTLVTYFVFTYLGIIFPAGIFK